MAMLRLTILFFGASKRKRWAASKPKRWSESKLKALLDFKLHYDIMTALAMRSSPGAIHFQCIRYEKEDSR